jgi:ABC-2 type transport system ATP-binding protein
VLRRDQPAVAVQALEVDRGGRRVLHGIDLELHAGRVTALVGPSGCGKTTLMRAVVGVQRTHGGTVTVLGEPAGAPHLRHRIGYVTQAPSVYLDLSVQENLRYFAAVAGAPRTDIDTALATVRLDARRGQLVRTMSGGEQTRVSIAAALLGHPDLLVLDEPTVGLDPVLRQELWAVFHALALQDRAVLVSTHVMDEAAECDDLVLMREGVIVAATTPAELLQRTHAPDLSAAFLAAVKQAVPA